MNPKKSVFALIAGLLFGALSFFLLYQKAQEIEQKTTPTEILFSNCYIPAGSYLKQEMVEKKRIPETFAGPSAIQSIQEVEGLTTLVPISAGEQIFSNKFVSAENSLSFALSPGYRAYTLEVNEVTGIGGLLRPGNHIDILTKTESNKREITAFVFQNLQVLAVGQKLDRLKKLKSNQESLLATEDSEMAGYSTVTLAVTPEQAETLMYLDGQPIRLVLRASNDDEIVSISPKSDSEIIAKLGHFASAPKTRGIEIIRGKSGQGE
jgi:pilus assembly protein CpaB